MKYKSVNFSINTGVVFFLLLFTCANGSIKGPFQGRYVEQLGNVENIAQVHTGQIQKEI